MFIRKPQIVMRVGFILVFLSLVCFIKGTTDKESHFYHETMVWLQDDLMQFNVQRRAKRAVNLSELTNFQWDRVCFPSYTSSDVPVVFYFKEKQVAILRLYPFFDIQEDYVKGSLHKKCIYQGDDIQMNMNMLKEGTVNYRYYAFWLYQKMPFLYKFSPYLYQVFTHRTYLVLTAK